MMWLASFFGFGVLCVISLNLMRPYRRRLVQSTGISAPCHVVFDLISDVERVPAWYWEPVWLPRFLRASKLSRWSEHIPHSFRMDVSRGDDRGDIQIRDVRGREFGYCFVNPGVMTYETIFRIAPRQNGCQLTWEIRYQLHRSIDKVMHPMRGDREVWNIMHESLQSIRCLSESIAVRPRWEKCS